MSSIGQERSWASIGACGLAMGVAGDLLLRPNGDPGLNFALLFLGVATGIVLLLPRERWRNAETVLLVGVGVLLGGSIVVRDSIGLNAIAFLGASLAFALVGFQGGRAWIARSGLSDMVEAVGTAGVRTALGLVSLLPPTRLFGAARSGGQPTDADPGPGKAAMIVRGALIASPFLLVFGILLASADPIFDRLIRSVVRIDLDPLLEHLVPIAVLGWMATGYFSGLHPGNRVRGLTDRRLRRATIGLGEAGIAIGLVDLLFVSFVLVQLRYLFGGAELVESTAGLTYAEYARSGAAELALCAAIAIPSLLLADWSVRPSRYGREERIFRSLASVQIALLLVVMASAFARLRIYQDAYGLTVSRVYGTVGLGWLGVVAVLLVVTVLRGHRDRFAPSALGAAFIAVVALIAANPEAVITRENIARMNVADAPELDLAYLTELSADAVPAMLGSVDEVPIGDRCLIATTLLDRWGASTAPEDWRVWDLATARARRAVAAAEPRLLGMVEGGCSTRSDARGSPATTPVRHPDERAVGAALDRLYVSPRIVDFDHSMSPGA